VNGGWNGRARANPARHCESNSPLVEHLARLLVPRQRRHEAKVVDADRRGLAVDDQPFQHLGCEPGEAQEAADVAVGQALVGGEIGERGDVTAFQPLPPAPCPADGAQQVRILRESSSMRVRPAS